MNQSKLNYQINTMKKLTQEDYDKYMKSMERVVSGSKEIIKDFKAKGYEWVSKLNYDDWVRFQRGELKLFEGLNTEKYNFHHDGIACINTYAGLLEGKPTVSMGLRDIETLKKIGKELSWVPPYVF